jgi:hypothetical protein
VRITVRVSFLRLFELASNASVADAPIAGLRCCDLTKCTPAMSRPILKSLSEGKARHPNDGIQAPRMSTTPAYLRHALEFILVRLPELRRQQLLSSVLQ